MKGASESIRPLARLLAQGYMPCCGIQSGATGALWYRRGRQRIKLHSAALAHLFAELGPSCDYRVAAVPVDGRFGLLLSWCREPVALYVDVPPSSANAQRAFAEYRGAPIVACHDRFFIQSRYSTCLTETGYTCPVLGRTIRRRAVPVGRGIRKFRFVIINCEQDHAEEPNPCVQTK
jgi:hypothetical protein